MKALSGTQISSHIKKSISAENEPEVVFFGSFILIGKITKSSYPYVINGG